MAKKETALEQNEDKDKEFNIPVDAKIDVEVEVESLAGDPYHKNGERFKMAKTTAEKLVERGCVKIIK